MIRHYPECASTNDLARAWILDPRDPAPEGACVTADFQTRGRGRRGRRWDAAPGENLLMSVVLRPSSPSAHAWELGFAASLAVADALAALGPDPRLKWPNDVLLAGKKVSGILIETVSTPGGWAAIAGIGVNVNQTRFGAAAEYPTPPTSLRLATGQAHDPLRLAEDVRRALLAREAQRRAPEGGGAILEAWRERLSAGAFLVRGDLRAVLETVDDQGRARVRLPDGTFAVWTSVDGEDAGNGV